MKKGLRHKGLRLVAAPVGNGPRPYEEGIKTRIQGSSGPQAIERTQTL